MMHCTCCNSDRIKKKFKKKSFQIYECTVCGFQFVHPLPSKETVETYYNQTRVAGDIKTQIKKYLHDFYHDSNNPKRDWYNRILTVTKKYLKKESLNILEIGSARGYFIDFCNNSGHTAIGTESTQDYADSSKGLINGEIIYIENDDYTRHFNEARFDLIYLEHVFEHVLHPAELLEKLKYLLHEQGIIIIVVPNHKSLLARIFRRNYQWTTPPDHLYFYNLNSLSTLAKSRGLLPVEHWTGDYFHRSIYQFYSLDYFIHNFYRVLNKLFKLNIQIRYSYKYPGNLPDIFTLIPYFLLFPLIHYSGKKCHMGNELTLILQKETLRDIK